MSVDYSKVDQSLVACFSPTFKRQTAIKTALLDAAITKRHPFITPSKPTRTRNRRIVYHCNGIDIYEEKITDQFSRWTFGFPADATLISGWMAMNYGSALAPVGTPANELQTISANAAATTITFDIEGRTEVTSLIPADANAAAIKAAIVALNMFDTADVTIVGTIAAGFTIQYTGKYEKADVPVPVFSNGAVVAETTKGANKIHAISRSSSVEQPLTSFIIGWEEDETFKKHKGFACDAVIIDAQNREDLGCTVELIGRADTEEVIDYVVPACQTVNPIEVDSCRFRVDDAYIMEDLSSFRFERRNNIPVGGGAFPWADKNIGKIWRGPKPTETLTVGFYGSEAHPQYVQADEEQKLGIIADLGNPGDRYSIIAPNTKLKLGEPDITFDNDLRRSVVNITGTPHFDATINASSRGEANISQATAFLTT